MPTLRERLASLFVFCADAGPGWGRLTGGGAAQSLHLKDVARRFFMNDCPVESKTAAQPPKSWFELLKGTYKKWSADSASRLSAAFSYHAIFSIGPLLIIAITLLSFIYGQKAAEDQVRP